MKLGVFHPPDSAIPLFFNIEQSVGKNARNASRDDILLVQYLLRKIAQITPTSAAEGEEIIAVMRKTPQNGIMDEATIAGITAFQKNMRFKFPRTIVDGRVSSAKSYRYGSGYYTIVALNAYIRRHRPNIWPKLHDLPDFPSGLKAKIKQLL